MIPIVTTTTKQRLESTNTRFGSGSAVVTEGKPQFSAAKPSVLKVFLSSLWQKIDKFLSWAGANRTREMLVEDFGGFGVLRTVMDSLRGFFFGIGGLNIPAASERLAREGFSIVTDNILAGVSAAGFGKIADRRLGSYSSKWTDFPTLELFKQTIRDHAKDANTAKTAEQAFLKGLAQQITKAQPNQQKACLEILQNYWENPAQNKAAMAAQLTKNLGLKSFDIRVGQNVFKLDNLLDDLRLFKEHMTRLPVQTSWQETAQKTLNSTLKVKNWKLGFVGLGMAATFAVPYLINQATKKLFNIDYYTGEIGLVKDKNKPQPTVSTFGPQMGQPSNPAVQLSPSPLFAQTLGAQPAIFNNFTATPASNASQSKTPQAKNPQERRPSYIKDAWKNGNPWPVLLALVPLPIAAGLLDTVNWKGLKPFSKAWRNALDFSKSAPFTTQQQMAATFALLITSRLMASRSDNEFRERLIDSGLGWLLWILGTPFMKKAVASHLDKQSGASLLLKEVPINGNEQTRKMLRSASEIEHLSAYMKEVTPEMAAKAQQQLKRLSQGSLITSLFLLGIVEPFIAIQWTKYNSRKKTEANPTPPQAPSLPSLNSPVFSQGPNATYAGSNNFGLI